jgi:ABC-2 type transport system ATP-binding protein
VHAGFNPWADDTAVTGQHPVRPGASKEVGGAMLELTKLRKRYGDVVALDGLSLTARPGRLVGFLGPNGAGKTTAMRAVFGLVRLDAGVASWYGEPVTAADRLRFGYMPEQRGLYPRMPVGAQLTYLARLRGLDAAAARRATRSWLDDLGLGERAEGEHESETRSAYLIREWASRK